MNVDDAGRTISELLSGFADSVEQQGTYASNTLRAVRSDVVVMRQQVSEWTWDEDIPFVDLLRNFLFQFVRTGNTRSTRARRLFTTRRFSAYVASQLHEVNFMANLSLSDVKENETGEYAYFTTARGVLSEEQIDCLVQAGLKNFQAADPFPLIILSLLLSGLKVGEAIELAWTQVFEDDGLCIQVGDRLIGINPRLPVDAIRSAFHFARGLRLSKGGRVFHLSRSAFLSRVRSLGDECGLPGIRPNDLRWKYMYDLVAQNVPLEVVAEQLGVSIEYIRRFHDIKK